MWDGFVALTLVAAALATPTVVEARMNKKKRQQMERQARQQAEDARRERERQVAHEIMRREYEYRRVQLGQYAEWVRAERADAIAMQRQQVADRYYYGLQNAQNAQWANAYQGLQNAVYGELRYAQGFINVPHRAEAGHIDPVQQEQALVNSYWAARRGYVPAFFEPLFEALSLELKDMEARLTAMQLPLPIPTPPLMGYAAIDRRTGRLAHIGNHEHALQRRYELTRRCRRMASGMYGPDAVRLDGDDRAHGELYRVAGAPAKLLLVTCPSMKKPHILYVPTTMETARQARAWTFGMSPEEFAPVVET